MNSGVRRGISAVLAAALLGTAACAGGPTRLDREDLLDPPAANAYVVTTNAGQRLTFISLHLENDDLLGTVRRTSTQTVGEGETQRENVTNRYEELRIPWAEVASVEAEGGKSGPSGVLLAGGAIVLGAAAFLLLTGGSTETADGGGGGKGF